MKNLHKKTAFVIIIPRDEIEIFCRAITETIQDVEIDKTPQGGEKYIVRVKYPDGTNPQKFVDMGRRFNELLQADTK